MQNTDQQSDTTFCQHSVLHTYPLRNRTNDQPAQGLHAEKGHCIKADHSSAHVWINGCLNKRVADRDLRHHSKACYHCTHKRSKIKMHVRKCYKPDTEDDRV